MLYYFQGRRPGWTLGCHLDAGGGGGGGVPGAAEGVKT